MNNFLERIKEIRWSIEKMWSRKTRWWSSDRLWLALFLGFLPVVVISIRKTAPVWQFLMHIIGGMAILYFFFTLLICIPWIRRKLRSIFNYPP